MLISVTWCINTADLNFNNSFYFENKIYYILKVSKLKMFTLVLVVLAVTVSKII
jgi:hypothetical protein